MMNSSHGSSDSYHATVSKMALRYSQHQLPHPSDLMDPTEEHLFESPAHDLEEDEEEDKDLQSVISSNTMIYHHHLKTNSSKSSSTTTKKVSFNLIDVNPMTEIREIQMDKSLFIDIFDQYFDESTEGDIDINEFKKGLSKLCIHMPEDHIRKLFNVLLLNGDADDADSDYLQSEQFVDFLTRRFTATQTVQFQNILLNAIRSKTNRSSNFKPEQAEKWHTTQVNLAEIEMRQAMEQMVGNEMEKIKISQVRYTQTNNPGTHMYAL